MAAAPCPRGRRPARSAAALACGAALAAAALRGRLLAGSTWAAARPLGSDQREHPAVAARRARSGTALGLCWAGGAERAAAEARRVSWGWRGSWAAEAQTLCRRRRLLRTQAATALAAARARAPAPPRAPAGDPADTTKEVIEIIVREMPSYKGEVAPETALAKLEAEADSLDTLEAMMELEEHFHVELEDEEMAKVTTVQELADLIARTPRGMKLRTVDDKTYDEMVRRAHAENRWGELDLLGYNKEGS